MPFDLVIDLSHHNNVTSFNEIASSGVIGVIHKATQGASGYDDQYAARKVRAEKVGLKWGSYHFGTGDDAAAQAANLLAHTKGKGLLVLDWESNPSGETMSREQAEAFVQCVRQQTGRWPLLYSGLSFLGSQLRFVHAEATPLVHCPLWLARYGPMPTSPAPFSSWALWQYTSEGKCPGVGGNVDRSRSKVDGAALRQLWESWGR